MKNLILKFILIFLVLSCSGGDDSTQDEVVTPQNPAIIVDKTSISFNNTMVTKSSNAITLLVESKNVDTSLNLSVSDGFEMSIDNLSFSNTLTVDANQSKTIYVRFTPSQIQKYNGSIDIENSQANNVKINLSGDGIQLRYNYKTFSKERLAWTNGNNRRAASQNFDLHNDNSNIESIKMYIRLDCPSVGCDGYDRYANILIKNPDTNHWYEIARHITPYGVGNSQLDRGLEVDVTDFKSLLMGDVELKIFADTWVDTGWAISVEFDFLAGEPDFKYYSVTTVIQFNNNSLGGVPYGRKINPAKANPLKPDVITSQKEIDDQFDLKKSISFGPNIKSAHFRTIISGWGHATPLDAGGRGCAEWCFRTHKIKIDDSEKFSHYMGPVGCASNPINNQAGNWTPDRAGWCPGMLVPVRIDKFGSDMSNRTINFEYYFQPWVNNFQYGGDNRNAYNAISTFIVLKSDQQIDAATISD